MSRDVTEFEPNPRPTETDHDRLDRMAMEKAIAHAIRSTRRETLEEAAKVVETSEMFCKDEKILQRQLVKAIRALKEEPR